MPGTTAILKRYPEAVQATSADSPSISVLIVNFFGADLTARAVASVFEDFPQAEVLVVDNSVDAEEAAKLAAGVDPRCRILIAERNLGFGAANELALANTSGQHVMLVNPDAVLVPGCLAQLAATLDSHPRAGLVAPRAWWDTSRQFALPVGLMESPFSEFQRELATRLPLLGKMLSSRFRKLALKTWQARSPVRVDMISGAALMFRRSAVTHFGMLFDPQFFMFYEDTDLSRRVLKAGYELLLDPAAEVIHTWRMDPHKGPLMADGRSRYLAKHFPGSRWRRWVEQIRLRATAAEPAYDFTELGSLQSPPALRAERSMADGWLLEISPSPLFIPAAGRLGEGEEIHFDQAWFDNLAPGQYFARLARRDGGDARFWSWSRLARACPENDLSRLNASLNLLPGDSLPLPDCGASSALLKRFGLERNAAEPDTLLKIRQTTWQTRWFAPGETADALALFQAAFNKPMDARLWDWKYQREARRGIAVWRDDKLVAFFGWAPRKLLFFGAPLSAVQCCDVMTDPGERGMLSREGPFFSATLTFAECCLSRREGHSLAFGFPSDRHFRLGQRLGVYFALDKLLELQWACKPEPASLRYRIRPWLDSGEERQQVENCWQAMAASLADHVLPVRDVDFLDYRYRQHPLFSYDCLLVSDRWLPQAIGLLVLRRHDDWVELIDVVGDRADFPVLVAAARRFTARVGRKEMRGWITGGCASLLDSGDCTRVDTGITLPLAKDPALADISHGRWFLMAGDSDFH